MSTTDAMNSVPKRAADHVDEDAKLQPKVHDKHAIDSEPKKPNTLKRMPKLILHEVKIIGTVSKVILINWLC